MLCSWQNKNKNLNEKSNCNMCSNNTCWKCICYFCGSFVDLLFKMCVSHQQGILRFTATAALTGSLWNVPPQTHGCGGHWPAHHTDCDVEVSRTSAHRAAQFSTKSLLLSPLSFRNTALVFALHIVGAARKSRLALRFNCFWVAGVPVPRRFNTGQVMPWAALLLRRRFSSMQQTGQEMVPWSTKR